MNPDSPTPYSLILRGITVKELSEVYIANQSASGTYVEDKSWQYIVPKNLEINTGVFTNQYSNAFFPEVTVVQQADQVEVSCTCAGGGGKLCAHQALVLTALLKRDDLAIFFNDRLRDEKFRKFAADYGLEHEPDLDRYFKPEYSFKKLVILPRSPALMPVTRESLSAINKLVAGGGDLRVEPVAQAGENICVVLKQHKYYNYLFIALYSAGCTTEGKIKNPLNPVNPLDLIWTTGDQQELKFFAAVNKFQNHLNGTRSEADITALRAIIQNPLQYKFYYHDPALSGNITAHSVIPVSVSRLPGKISLSITKDELFYELGGKVEIGRFTYELKDLVPKFNYFVLIAGTLYLVDQLPLLGMLDLLKSKQGNILIHHSKYAEFKKQVLSRLEASVDIAYTQIPVATPRQLAEQGFDSGHERIIYLSDFGAHVMIVPVMRYGEVEIPIRTRRQVYAVDNRGREFSVRRDLAAEDEFTALVIRQHPYFEEQLDTDNYYYYLHKKHFLNEDWFLEVFEEWQKKNITVLGFNELEGNKLNPNKVTITIRVLSGINWFNADIKVRAGKQRASLKQVYRALRNKSKYVQLDDGTTGILPLDWIEKFSAYFNAGEIVGDETLQLPKINFGAIHELYDQADLDEEVKHELTSYRDRFLDFEQIKDIGPPAGLTASLRGYQQQGVNWLNFLDDFDFGGCLADDMGLGKSIQVLAFLLSQREKVQQNTNLLVVPTSLIFNWVEEIRKFAPSLKLLVIYGAGRVKNVHDFDQYEIVLTSYGTLLSDVHFLKTYPFNYVVLDESQNIKNPESQRYKAARLLTSRNRIVVTGTPIENNVFDLYGQFSFACPGLLGSKQYFRDIYSIPIDRFKSSTRATELQNKIRPFLLRRTKQQVAAELPDKTEMVLHCEMGAQQRRIYDAYEKEFREYISATTNEELLKSPMNVLKGLTRLRQICDSPALLTGDKLHGDESAKIELLMEQILSKSPQHKILVFSQFVSMLTLIKKELLQHEIPFSWLTGSTRNREKVVTEFQEDAKMRVFLISLKAGGTGLNLTAADYVYLVDPWWNPAVENQAIDRSHRIGQDKKVVAIRLICPDTVEEKIGIIQESKKDLVQNLVQADSLLLKSLTKEDLLRLLERHK